MINFRASAKRTLILLPLLSWLGCETPAPPGGGSCDIVQELQWGERSPLGFSGSELAAAASGSWQLSDVQYPDPSAASPALSLIYPSPFQVGAPLDMGIEAEQGRVQYVSGVGCISHLRVHSQLVLGSQEGLLSERLPLHLESANREKVHFMADLENFSVLQGQLKNVQTSPPGAKILGLKIQGELQSGQAPTELRVNAQLQAPMAAGSKTAPAPVVVNILSYDRRQGKL